MIKDAKGRKWFMRFKQYQTGWQWNARCGNHGQSSGAELFATKALAEADARRVIPSRDVVAIARELTRCLMLRGSECQLTADDIEAIVRAGEVAR
jgi:hypothetical protein